MTLLILLIAPALRVFDELPPDTQPTQYRTSTELRGKRPGMADLGAEQRGGLRQIALKGKRTHGGGDPVRPHATLLDSLVD